MAVAEAVDRAGNGGACAGLCDKAAFLEALQLTFRKEAASLQASAPPPLPTAPFAVVYLEFEPLATRDTKREKTLREEIGIRERKRSEGRSQTC